MSIRLRLALVFTLLTAIAFAVGGWLFESQLSSGLVNLLDSQLTTQLAQVDRYVAPTGGTSEQRSAAGSAAPSPGEYFFQVVDKSGRVRRASNEAGPALLLSPAQLRTAQRGRLFITTRVESEHARLTAAPYPSRQGWVAVAGASLDTLDRTLSDVTLELVVGGIAAVVVAALGAYLLARAALSPVERLRREAAALSAHDRRATLAVPATRDEIAALARTMNELLGRLHDALARQRALVADAGHELRNPFAILAAELELAGKPGRTPEELRAAVHSAAVEVDRLSRLANDLLLLARSDEDQLLVQPVSTDLRALVDRSVARAAERLDAADVRCQVEIPLGTTALIDPDRVRQAIDNLLDNAVRFAPPASQITVAAHRSGGADLVVSVADEGPGFPPEYLPHAFERFRRPDTSRARDNGGAGLGLAIVQAIVAAHHGTVEARNRPEGGAIVEIVLPAAVDLPATPPAGTKWGSPA